jgi:hypothetical protein
MGTSPWTKCVTCKGQKIPQVKQDGKWEIIAPLQAVWADGFVFGSFLIAKRALQCFNWYKNVHAEDMDAHFGVSTQKWTDNTMAMHCLTEASDPIGRVCCSERKCLSKLNRYASQMNYTFLSYWEVNNIIVFCLPAHSTHHIQPRDVVLYGPLQHGYRKAAEDYFLSTICGINPDQFFPLFKQAHINAYTKHNI